MTIDEKQVVVMAIHNLVYLIRQLEPDPEYRESYGVDEVIAQAEQAMNILTKEGE